MNFSQFGALALCGFLLSLSSCENQQLAPITPDQSVGRPTETTGLQFDDVTVSLAKKHTLVKHGNLTLAYNANGTLQKITEGNRTTEYAYSPGKISIVTFVAGKKTEGGNYYLDANGRCKESDVKGYSVEYGIPVTTLHPYIYEYDNKGRLAKRYHSIYPKDRIEFIYNADGNLTETLKFDHANNLVEKNTYEYQYAGSALLLDQYRLNPLGVDNMDPYLRIFGKISKNLVQRLKTVRPVYGGVNSDYRFSYVLDNDGYVTQSKKFVTSNSLLLQIVPFEYVISDLIITP